jgi:hypothetical protein
MRSRPFIKRWAESIANDKKSNGMLKMPIVTVVTLNYTKDSDDLREHLKKLGSEVVKNNNLTFAVAGNHSVWSNQVVAARLEAEQKFVEAEKFKYVSCEVLLMPKTDDPVERNAKICSVRSHCQPVTVFMHTVIVKMVERFSTTVFFGDFSISFSSFFVLGGRHAATAVGKHLHNEQERRDQVDSPENNRMLQHVAI